jgi:hypothetical protein
MNNKQYKFEDTNKEVLKKFLDVAEHEQIDIDVFQQTFPLIENDGYVAQFYDAEEVVKFLNSQNIDSTEHYKYIFTCVDGDGQYLILLNGWHLCNRLFYVVSTKSWSTGDKEKDSKVYIEALY